jgi:hypothetical protein
VSKWRSDFIGWILYQRPKLVVWGRRGDLCSVEEALVDAIDGRLIGFADMLCGKLGRHSNGLVFLGIPPCHPLFFSSHIVNAEAFSHYSRHIISKSNASFHGNFSDSWCNASRRQGRVEGRVKG